MAGHKTAPKERNHQESRTGTLFVVATPIGNLEDITLRATRILDQVDLIASEDTRHTRKLLSHLGISTRLISYYKNKETTRAKTILAKLKDGLDVALVSDAGTPGISDPGSILLREAHSHGIQIIPVPGPSALTAAISACGLSTGSFLFLGFLPSRPAERHKALKRLIHEPHDLIFYESPRRLLSTLKDCLTILGNRNAFWARELTKLYEEIRSDTLEDLVESIQEQSVKGESVLLIQGAAKEERHSSDDMHGILAWYKERTALSLKDVVEKVSKDLGLPKSPIYKEALRVWRKKEDG